jgi:deoxyribose-phosphate aldolase
MHDPELERLVDRVAEEVARRFSLGPTTARGADGQPFTPPFCAACDDAGHCASNCATPALAIIEAGASRLSAAAGMGEVDRAIAATIDHTLLKADATKDKVAYLCAEAAKYGFASVCVNPFWVSYCAQLLAGHPVAVCTVVGFPLGATSTAAKAYEAERAIADGAGEIDMVINVGALKSGLIDAVADDLQALRTATRGKLLKVILETALLTDEEKVLGCRLSQEAGADFVKTSTGFSTGGATAGDVALMRRVVGEQMGVKASGGIGNKRTAALMLASGATRIGASAGVKILHEVQGPGVKTASASGGY